MRAERGGAQARGAGRAAAAAMALLLVGCEQPDYSGASFKPVEGPKQDALLLLYLFRPQAREVPWGDAAFFHRASPAAAGAAPVSFHARLGGEDWVASDSQGGAVFRRPPGTYGLRVAFGDRVVHRRVELAGDHLEVALWSLDAEDRVFGLRRRYPSTEIVAGPVADVSRRLPALQDLRVAIEGAFSHGEERHLERLLAEDFRDPLGGRRDFVRAVRHRHLSGRPRRLVGDTWVDLRAEAPRMEVVLEDGHRRTFPTLDLVEDPRGVGGYRIRSLY